MKKRGKLRRNEIDLTKHLLDITFYSMTTFKNNLSYKGFKEQGRKLGILFRDIDPLREWFFEVEEQDIPYFDDELHRTLMSLELPFKCFLHVLELDGAEGSELREHILRMLKCFQEVRESLPERCPEYRGEKNESRPT